MFSTTLNAMLIVILAVILVDLYCQGSEVTNSRRSIQAQNSTGKVSNALLSRFTTSTPWPALGQPVTKGSRKWIKQNNIWIKNEQTASAVISNNKGNTQNQNVNVDKTQPKLSGTATKDAVEKTDDTQEMIVDGNSNATDDELREFSEALLKKDVNNAMKLVTVNLQGKTISRSTVDEAPLPLLNINTAAYKIPSIEKLILLYNNYFVEASQNEVYSGQERIEENNLLDTMLSTPVMQFTRSFLVRKGLIGKDPKEFKDLLRQLWFYMYSRGGGKIGSSGFEHIFLAEIKNNQVSGLHNWVYFNEEESQGRANYLGYMKKIDLGEKGSILKYHFTFHDIDKPVGSMFIGTSPELEMALYTTCFMLRADRICPLKMNDNRFIIRTYTFRYRGKNMIGSAFPEI